jgi:hypothetical protein
MIKAMRRTKLTMIATVSAFMVAILGTAVAGTRSTSAPSAQATRYLLHVSPLSDEITNLWVTEQPGSIVVQIDGQCTNVGGTNLKPLSGMMLQVWLLRADGTALSQRWGVGVGGGGGGCRVDSMSFSFEHVPPKELAGLVVSADRKLFVREIKANP